MTFIHFLSTDFIFPDEGALDCVSCYDGFRLGGGICLAQCLIGHYGVSQVTESYFLHSILFIYPMTRWWVTAAVWGGQKMLAMELLLCNKLSYSLAGVGALRTRVMSQSARRATRPASNAKVPACGTARRAPRCRSCLMTDAACPAVELKRATVTNWSPGSAVTAQSHEVKADAATSHRSRMRHCWRKTVLACESWVPF